MTRPGNRPAVTDPPQERPRRPAEVRLEAAARTTRRIAIAAIAVAAVGLALTAWRAVTPADAGCQTTAWDATPAIAELPLGWTLGATQYDTNRKSMTFLGPAPADSTTNRAVLYATITCYPQGAADSVSRSAAAATAAGQAVTARQDLGDQAFIALDTSGASFIQLRRGPVVVYLAASGDATADEADAVAAAFDHAMGGPAPGTALGTPDVNGSPTPRPSSSPSASPSSVAAASASPAAPELEAALPTKVGDIALTVESAIGATILGTDQGSGPMIAALRSEGKTADDLRVAQAFDPTRQSDLTIIAMSVAGMKADALRSLVLNSWLAASSPGVKSSSETIAGHAFTKVDYGSGVSSAYVLLEADRVIIIETPSADTAAQAAAALP
jgi:hypothetical protein